MKVTPDGEKMGWRVMYYAWGPSAACATECMADIARRSSQCSENAAGGPFAWIAPCGAVIAPAVIDLASFSMHCSFAAREKFPVLGHVEQRSLERPPVEI